MQVNGDEYVVWRHCFQPFTVSPGERKLYGSRTGDYTLPRYCRACRILRRQQASVVPVTRLPALDPREGECWGDAAKRARAEAGTAIRGYPQAKRRLPRYPERHDDSLELPEP